MSDKKIKLYCPVCGFLEGEECHCTAEELDHFYGTDIDFDDDGFCQTCFSSGFISICCDDLCQGEDGCIHGGGNIVCPDCHGRSAW